MDWLYVEVSSTGVRDLQLEGRRPTRSYGRGVASNEAMTIGEYRPESISINSFIIGQAQLGPRVGYSYWLVTGYWLLAKALAKLFSHKIQIYLHFYLAIIMFVYLLLRLLLRWPQVKPIHWCRPKRYKIPFSGQAVVCLLSSLIC